MNISGQLNVLTVRPACSEINVYLYCLLLFISCVGVTQEARSYFSVLMDCFLTVMSHCLEISGCLAGYSGSVGGRKPPAHLGF